MRDRPLLSVLFITGLLALSFTTGCAGCSDDPPGGDVDAGTGGACENSDDCPVGQSCSGGECVSSLPIADAGSSGGTDAGPGNDAGAGPIGVLDVLPGTYVEFGAQRIGVPVERAVALKNIGNADLTILHISLDDNTSGEFSAEPTGNVSQVLSPNQELLVTIWHTPADGIPDQAELKVLHDGTDSLTTVTLFAEFKGDSELSISDDAATTTPSLTAVDFGDANFGASVSRTLFIRNSGDVDSVLSVEDLTLTPSSAGFSIMPAALSETVMLSSWDGLCPSGLGDCDAEATACTDGVCVDGVGNPLDALAVVLTFSPNSAAAAEAILTITHDEGSLPDSQTDIALTGSGVAGALAFLPSPVDFPDAYVGRTQTQEVTISNPGTAGVTIDAFTVAGNNPPFTIIPNFTLPHDIFPGETATFDVEFAPTAAGTNARELTVESNLDPDPTLSLNGTAREAPSAVVLDAALDDLDPLELPFGDVYVGLTSNQEINLANLGPGQLTITRMTISGAQAARFSINPDSFANALPPWIDPANPSSPSNVKALLTVAYTPSTVTQAVDNATLTIETDDPENPAFDIALSGRAIQPVIRVSPSETVAFSGVNVMTSDMQTISIHNDGFGPLTISEIEVPTVAEFTLDPMGDNGGLGWSIAPGASMDVDITFAPALDQVYADAVKIFNSDAANPQLTLTLTGEPDTCYVPTNGTLVDPVTCDFTCNTGYHRCGTLCKSNSSYLSCGTQDDVHCTPCNFRSHTTRGCTASTATCTYTCNADYYDLDDDKDVAQGTNSTGCEYECDVATPTAESCNLLDDDCNGIPDDGLTGDALEVPANTNYGNESCNNRKVLDDVVEGNEVPFAASLYPNPGVGMSADYDWFEVEVKEQSDTCIPLIDDEDYCTTFTLLAPGESNVDDGNAIADYELQVIDQSCNGTSFTRATSGGEKLELAFGGTCGLDDDRKFIVQIYPLGGNTTEENTCMNYTLKVKHEENKCPWQN
jgi:hypothetical protein